MIKVILLIDCASEFDRKLLRGIMKYSKEHGPWLFYRIPSDFRMKMGQPRRFDRFGDLVSPKFDTCNTLTDKHAYSSHPEHIPSRIRCSLP